MSCCPKPTICCCCCVDDRDAPLRNDECMCGCPYLNGPIPVIIAQILVFIGFMFSFAAMGDCEFVRVPPEDGFQPFPDDTEVSEIWQTSANDKIGLGMFTFEKPNGVCFYYDNTYGYGNDILDEYRAFTGSTWDSARLLGTITTGVAFVDWLYILSYSCSAQLRPFRYGTGLFLLIALVILQGMTFLVFNNGFCTTTSCDFGRAAGFAVGALCCYFFGGVAFFFTRDYPGAPNVEDKEPVAQSEIMERIDEEAVDEKDNVPTDEAEVHDTEDVEVQAEAGAQGASVKGSVQTQSASIY